MIGLRRRMIASALMTAVIASKSLAQPPPPAPTPSSKPSPANPPPPVPSHGLPPAAPATPEDAEFLRQRGDTEIRLHDPSTIIACAGEFWVFATGINTPAFHSKDLRHWERAGPVNMLPHAWTKQLVPGGRDRNYWAPDIIKVADKYMLFFAASAFGKNTSGIGIIFNKTLDPNNPAYAWNDGGLVVSSHAGDDFNAIDPAPLLDGDGRLWLAFGSFWSGIKLIELDPATGRRIAPDSPMYSLAHASAIEAPYLYRHDGYYYLLASYGLCCRGVNSTYHTRVGRSRNVTGPYVDRDGTDLLHDGGTMVADRDGILIGPGCPGIIQVNGEYWFSCHFYDGSARGVSKLAVRPLTWDEHGWPVVGKMR